MSLVFLIAFLFEAAEGTAFEYLDYGYILLWALFAIADALWFGNLFGKRGREK